MMSDDALWALSLILQAAECLGEMPQSIEQIMVTLIPKASGGTRPINLYPGIERLWAKARLPWLEQGEEQHLHQRLVPQVGRQLGPRHPRGA